MLDFLIEGVCAQSSFLFLVLWELLAFLVRQESLCYFLFLRIFSFFPKDSRGSPGKKTLISLFSRIFLPFFREEHGKEDLSVPEDLKRRCDFKSRSANLKGAQTMKCKL